MAVGVGAALRAACIGCCALGLTIESAEVDVLIVAVQVPRAGDGVAGGGGLAMADCASYPLGDGVGCMTVRRAARS